MDREAQGRDLDGRLEAVFSEAAAVLGKIRALRQRGRRAEGAALLPELARLRAEMDHLRREGAARRG